MAEIPCSLAISFVERERSGYTCSETRLPIGSQNNESRKGEKNYSELVNVNLEEDNIGVLLRKSLHVRRDHLAGTAPDSKVIDNDLNRSYLKKKKKKKIGGKERERISRRIAGEQKRRRRRERQRRSRRKSEKAKKG